MNEKNIALIALIPPTAFVLVAIVSWFQSGIHPIFMKRLSIFVAAVGVLIAVACSCFVVAYGLIETPMIGVEEIGLSLRLDALSTLMLLMISLISFVVIKFSMNYLDGDNKQGVFLGRLAAVIASVELLVLSGNLGLLLVAWVLTSVSLHRLLVFYNDRPGAIIVARKKFIVARLADTCLLGAVILLYIQFGSGNFEIIFTSIKNNIATGAKVENIEIIAVLLVFTALLKSAQFPTHGWLIEVMETPTPVSALLHAGLLNAGPFLIIRMAYILELSSYPAFILIVVGSFTALFASVVFLTQTSIKTALGYSSVAHMGFSLFLCGLGLYPAAMLHLVAHSFYKAHAFLSSGSVIDSIRALPIISLKRKGKPINIVLGILLAFSIYMVFAMLWKIDFENQLSLLAIGAIITMGLSSLFISAIDSNGNVKLLVQASLLAIVVTFAFFSLESGMNYLLNDVLPPLQKTSMVKIVLICFVIFIYASIVFIQSFLPVFSSYPIYKSFSIHLRNGFYINTLFDRLVGALRVQTKSEQ